MRLLAYAPDGRRALFTTLDVDHDANLQAHAGWAIRRLDGSPLAGVCSLADERVPPTLADFDAAHPGPELVVA